MIESEQYNRGFEAGKTQAAITLMNGDSLVNYSEGYHAAVDQFGGDLKNPFEADSEADSHSLDILLDSVQKGIDLEESYLEIIEMLVAEDNELPDLPQDATIVEAE